MHGRAPDNRRAWDALADAYQQHLGWPADGLAWGFRCPPESELGVLGDVAGARVVVLGCGGGQDLEALGRMGAGALVGVDLSARQLAHARERLAAAALSARLVHGSAADLSPLSDASADLVVSVQALNYVADADRCLAEVARVLVRGGRLAFSVHHPADTATADEPPYGFVHSYFDVQRDWVWDGLADRDVRLRSWYRSVGDWFALVSGAGLTVERLLEPAPVEDPWWLESGWLSEDSYRKLDLVPATLIVAARRPAAPPPT